MTGFLRVPIPPPTRPSIEEKDKGIGSTESETDGCAFVSTIISSPVPTPMPIPSSSSPSPPSIVIAITGDSNEDTDEDAPASLLHVADAQSEGAQDDKCPFGCGVVPKSLLLPQLLLLLLAHPLLLSVLAEEDGGAEVKGVGGCSAKRGSATCNIAGAGVGVGIDIDMSGPCVR